MVFAVCLDIGGECAGALTGAMNTTSQIGSFVGSVVFGYLVDRFRNYDVPFIPMAGLLLIGTLLWFEIDPGERLIPATPAASGISRPVNVA